MLSVRAEWRGTTNAVGKHKAFPAVTAAYARSSQFLSVLGSPGLHQSRHKLGRTQLVADAFVIAVASACGVGSP
ncbi:unnamed protein product [Ectocarpus sp. 6 AP-2014]